MPIQTTKMPVMAASFFMFFCHAASAQSFVNGNLEMNTSVTCNWNMSNALFSSMMNGVVAFGPANEVDIQESSCGYSAAQNGNYFISIHQQATGLRDEVSFALTSPLIAGNTYALSYYDQANVIWDACGRIEIGLSSSPADFGTVIHTGNPVIDQWTEHVFTFKAPVTGSYITVRTKTELPQPSLTGWIFIDNFSFTCPLIDLGNDFILCEGDSIQLSPSVSNASYTWQDGSTGSTYTATQPGTYWVEVNFGNCKTSDTMIISETDVQALSLGNDTSLCREKPMLLSANIGQAAYEWSDGSGSKTCMITVPGTYWVTVTKNGCSKSDTITIHELDCTPDITMPNVFTPNGDGINDAFRPASMKNITSGTLTVCNRWGEQLYMTDDTAQGWDGRNRGSICSDGMYFWILEYKDVMGAAANLTGTVMLLR